MFKIAHSNILNIVKSDEDKQLLLRQRDKGILEHIVGGIKDNPLSFYKNYDHLWYLYLLSAFLRFVYKKWLQTCN